MTTKPKAKKFRIRRPAPQASAAQPTPANSQTAAPKPDAPQAGGQPQAQAQANAGAQPQAQSGEVSSAREVNTEQEIMAIRKEGLTGRQLRMARRVAQKHGLAPTSDFDAVRLLRAQGIDPFQRTTALDLVTQEQGGGGGGQPPANLPQTVPQPGNNLPSPELAPAQSREREIRDIQRDIVRRRRRRMGLLATRLAFFVGLPTLIAGYYYYNIATPMYETKSEFVIQKTEGQGSTSLGSLFAGTGFAASQDSITVQSYLESRDAMLRLDQDLAFKAHFSQPSIDAIQRLPAGATREDAYKVYKKRVKLGYDPTEGIIKMQVSAADPEISAEFSRALLGYAEQQVDELTQRLREDQMRDARASYEKAEEEMRMAQRRVIDLQEQFKVISGDVEVSLLTNLISTLELELTQERLNLRELMSNPRPNPAKQAPLERRIQNLEEEIANLRSQLTEGQGGSLSLARISSELAVAETDLQTRTLLLQQALQQLETARVEANRQVRYISQGVSPIAPDEATYPRAFENTVLAFLIFGGIYLMISLTAAVLRDQISS
ncbi:capsule biosynthesis protein [Pseudoruegeria sp. SHC-113]|uniref:capsule biosynthesis protein n=1 Tax=Pseudoruegeria sp. SHC-113 TaxID=2855439 RepID=UPI0021BBB213|nr:capsule biosynthesis protein [Pseudoruegeria sp. SHC-113]MCT8161108.1 capsule biosynthesis protein [Pseudoruegeria sp. SHC-113]